MSIGQINLWRAAVAEATKAPVGEFMWFRSSFWPERSRQNHWPFHSTATFTVKV